MARSDPGSALVFANVHRTIRAAGPGRVLVDDRQVAGLCRRCPVRLQSRMWEGTAHPDSGIWLL